MASEMDCEVIYAIPTTERDQEVIRLVEMIMRGQMMKPLIVTITGTHDNFRGQFVVLKRFQDQRAGKLNDFTETRLMVQRSLAIQCRQHVFEIDLNKLPSCPFESETLTLIYPPGRGGGKITPRPHLPLYLRNHERWSYALL